MSLLGTPEMVLRKSHSPITSQETSDELRSLSCPAVAPSVKWNPENASVSEAHSKLRFLSLVSGGTSRWREGLEGRGASRVGSIPRAHPPGWEHRTRQDRSATACREDRGAQNSRCHIWSVDLGVKNRRIRNGNFPSLWLKRDLSQQLEHVSALAKIMFVIRDHYARQAESIKL